MEYLVSLINFNENNLLTKVEIQTFMETMIVDEFSFLFKDKNKFMLGDIDTNLDVNIRWLIIDYQESLLLYIDKLQNFLLNNKDNNESIEDIFLYEILITVDKNFFKNLSIIQFLIIYSKWSFKEETIKYLEKI